jgi:imidazolonepropionase-like amidohydrolase
MFLISVILVAASSAFGYAQPLTALVGGTTYITPDAQPIRNGVVLIEDGRISGTGGKALLRGRKIARRIDCTGYTITAGFWNSHVHFFERKWAGAAAIPAPELAKQIEDMLTRYGFIVVFDLSSPWENTQRLRERIESGEVPGPGIRSTAQGLLPPKPGLPEAVMNFMGMMKSPGAEVSTAEEAAAAARKLLDEGVDGIKVFASAPSRSVFPEGGIRAVAEEAHRRGKLLFVHPNTGAEVLAALRGGADVVAHTTPYDGPWDEAIAAAIRSRPVALTPTLALWKYYMRHDRITAQEQTVKTETSQLRAWIAAGGVVLFGTDVGAVEYDPTAEYLLMAQAGMSFRQILASLTTAPAARFGESGQTGKIAAGQPADLVVLRGNPAQDIRALARVRYTLRAGKVIYDSDR